MDTPPQSQSSAAACSSDTAMSPSVSCPVVGSTPDSETMESMGVSDVSGRPPRPEPKKRKNSNPSNVWLHYTKVPNSDPPKAKCNYCKKDFMAHHKNGTSGLWQHHNICPYFKRKKGGQLDVGQMFLTHDVEKSTGSDVGTMGVTHKFCEKTIKDLIARMIIIDEMPFIVVQKHGFRALIHYLEPRFKMPSRITIMRLCMKLYLKEKEKLKHLIQSNGYRVSFTTDTWTSIQNFNYMCVTGHFIDVIGPCKREFCLLEGCKIIRGLVLLKK
ncbi:putative AC transposase [Morella rubra]|uniref:Putative AC transposase n=1 Tax=Morella rubra TaxID=262757 RepID=A0A6A1WBZ5_9ROSI|nr:putative AC transposase [Morella rubra]